MRDGTRHKILRENITLLVCWSANHQNSILFKFFCLCWSIVNAASQTESQPCPMCQGIISTYRDSWNSISSSFQLGGKPSLKLSINPSGYPENSSRNPAIEQQAATTVSLCSIDVHWPMQQINGAGIGLQCAWVQSFRNRRTMPTFQFGFLWTETQFKIINKI